MEGEAVDGSLHLESAPLSTDFLHVKRYTDNDPIQACPVALEDSFKSFNRRFWHFEEDFITPCG